MTDVIPGSVQDALDSFDADYKKWGNRAWLYAYPGNDVYYGMTSYYWCAMQVTRNLRGAGFDLAKSVKDYGYCPAVENYMYASPDWITKMLAQARPGQVILFKKNGTAYHIGMVSGYYNASTGILPTIEGDTSSPIAAGSENAGGALAYKTRYMPNYTTGGHSVHIFEHAYLGGTVTASTGSAASQAAVASVLQIGSTGTQVAHLQAGLNKVFPAYTGGGLAVDGSYGPLTAAAVKKFQAACHIAADGVVGATTLSYLAKYGIKL